MRLKKVSDFGRKAGACKACPAPKLKAPEPAPDARPDAGDQAACVASTMKNKADKLILV